MGPISARSYRSTGVAGLTGTVALPGDPAMAQAALVLAALAVGETLVTSAGDRPGLQATARALRAFGADIAAQGRDWRVRGVGIGGLAEPAGVIDLHDAATGLPLILGLAATHPLTCFVTGDAGPSFARLIEALQRQGARILARDGHGLPLGLAGARHPVPQDHRLTVAAPDVRAAILLAGLNTPGTTRVIEPAPGPDSLETLLRHFGATVRRSTAADGAGIVELDGQPELAARPIAVSGDAAAAAAVLVAAAIVPGAQLAPGPFVPDPARQALVATLAEMGHPLRGVDISPARGLAMIDDYPLLAVAAACADGITRLALPTGTQPRIAALAAGLRAAGVAVSLESDALVVTGNGRPPAGGMRLAAGGDAGLALAFLVLGMVSAAPIEIDDAGTVDAAFPGLAAALNAAGARIAAP